MAITMILSLLSGVALFLFGMSLMGDGLKKVAGNKLELILYQLTNTPIKGLLLGAGVTAIIQSSSATTVMVVGFVNSGMMKVAQAIGIIMGANIGTSITGWILCLSYVEGSGGIAALLSTATISAVVAIIGIIFKMFIKKEVFKNIGDILLGFAILMVGMQTMSGAVAPLKSNETFTSMFTMFTNPIMGILIGVLFTAVLQSSSAAVGILQALSMTGSITFASALPIIMGIGVGAACPVLLSSIGTNKNGKRTALLYLINDLYGMTVWGTIFYSVNAIVGFEFLGLVMTPVTLALMNTLFRTANIFSLAPFVKYIEKLVFLLVKDEAGDEDEGGAKDFDLLEERFLAYPDIAISQSRTALYGMVAKVNKNVVRALQLLKGYSRTEYTKIQDRENIIDKYEDKLGLYLMKLTAKSLSRAQANQVSKCLHTISDFERVADHAVNIAKVADELNEKKTTFSEEAWHELDVLQSAVGEIIQLTIQAFEADDNAEAKRVEPFREVIGILCDELKIRHIQRLQAGKCDIDKGFAFNDLLNNLERIADHCSNIAVATIEMEEKVYDTHEYLKSMREKKNLMYRTYFDEYAQKYVING